MNPYKTAVLAGRLAESIAKEINFLPSDQHELKDILGNICQNLSLYVIGSEHNDPELTHISQQNLQRYSNMFSKMNLIFSPFKSNATLTYNNLTVLLEEITKVSSPH